VVDELDPVGGRSLEKRRIAPRDCGTANAAAIAANAIRNSERPTPSRRASASRNDGGRRPVDRQGPQLTLEVHTPPSADRARAPSAT